jgi:hypothetical protein
MKARMHRRKRECIDAAGPGTRVEEEINCFIFLDVGCSHVCEPTELDARCPNCDYTLGKQSQLQSDRRRKLLGGELPDLRLNLSKVH